MEFLVIFAVCFLVLIALMFALVFGRTPSYRPSNEDVLALLAQAKGTHIDSVKWYLFLGVPITHDERLERVRLKAFEIDDRSSIQPDAGCPYDSQSRQAFAELFDELESAIAKDPVVRTF